MTTLPPLPTAPFRANSLAQHIQDFTLVEPLDGSRGGPSTLTTVDNSKIRSWPYRTIRFKLNRDLPREFEERLRWLDLDGVIPVGQMSLGSNSRPDDEVYIVTESDVRRQLGEMMIHVNQVIRFCRSNQLVPLDTKLPRGYPIWRESEMASSGRPDAHLHDFHPSPRRYIRRQRMFEAKKCVHLKSIIKTVAKQADRSEGFTMTVREDGTTVLDPSFDEDVSSDNKLRIRMILNQVMNEMFANYASTNVITDSVRFLVVRRDMDRQLEDGTGEANFLLALPIGNRGLLNLETPEEDLSPIEDVAVSLCDKPFGLWLALSFDDPTPSSALDSPPKQRPVPPMPKRSRKSGSRAPSSSSSSGILRRDQGRQGGGAGRGQGGGGASGAGTTGRSGPRNAGKHHPVFYGSKHKDAIPPELLRNDVESSSDSSLSSPLPILRPNMVGLLPLALSFLHLAETRETLAYMAPHTLALPLLDGEVFGPYTSLDPEYRSSASCDRTLVPQLLTIHGRDWHYRPDSPESVEEEEDPTRKSTTISSLSLSWDKCLGVGRPLELRLTSTLAYGHLWDAFRAVLISMTVENEVVESPMIVKMTCPVMFPSGSTRGKYREGYTELEARVAIANEDAIYRTVASKVNRNVVPSYHGLWGGSLRLDARWPGQREVWVMLLEDCGSAVSADDLSESDRNLVVSHYVDLHSAGVVHNDVEARHWLRHPDGGIRIIDFEAAKRVDGKASELAESEIEEVMYRLGLNSRRNGLPGGR